MTNKHKDIIRLARHWGATETYTRMIFETILEEQRTLDFHQILSYNKNFLYKNYYD